jgi:hypothetical protein
MGSTTRTQAAVRVSFINIVIWHPLLITVIYLNLRELGRGRTTLLVQDKGFQEFFNTFEYIPTAAFRSVGSADR